MATNLEHNALNAPMIAEVLLRGGRSAATPVAVVCDGTMPTERTVLTRLGDLAGVMATACKSATASRLEKTRSWRAMSMAEMAP